MLVIERLQRNLWARKPILSRFSTRCPAGRPRWSLPISLLDECVQDLRGKSADRFPVRMLCLSFRYLTGKSTAQSS